MRICIAIQMTHENEEEWVNANAIARNIIDNDQIRVFVRVNSQESKKINAINLSDSRWKTWDFTIDFYAIGSGIHWLQNSKICFFHNRISNHSIARSIFSRLSRLTEKSSSTNVYVYAESVKYASRLTERKGNEYRVSVLGQRLKGSADVSSVQTIPN